jgi:vitamin B12 transporter
VKHPARSGHPGATPLALLSLWSLLCLAAPAAARPAAGEAGPAATAAESAPVVRPAATVSAHIVVSASRLAADRERVGSSVTVITRADIERRRPATVADLLAAVPGVEVSRSGGPGGNVSVYLRGGAGSHTLVLVDGVRVNSTGSGAFDWADLTPDGVERIEVVRGPQSALYGSEALAGVISIISRHGTPGEPEATAGGEAGGNGWRRGRAAVAGGRGAWDWRVTASHQETDGVSRAAPAHPGDEEDRWRNTTAVATAGRTLGAGGSARLAVRAVDATTGLDAFDFFLGPLDDPNFAQDRAAVYGSLTLDKRLSPRWRQRVRLGVADEEVTTRDPDPEPAFHASRFAGTTSGAELQSDLTLGGGHTLALGYAFERREGEQEAAFAAEADLHSLLLEDRFEWRDHLAVTAGLRHDDHSVFGGETTWRGTAAWTAGPLRLHGSVGTAFKAPTFVDLYYPFYGNPSLAPETSESADLGLEVTAAAGRLTADLTAFASRVDDLITFDTATFLAANIARAEIRGVEASAAWAAGERWGARASYTLTDSEDAATGRLLPRRPRHRAVLAADWAPLPRLRASATLVAARDRLDFDGARLDDYERLDATVDHDLTVRLGAYLRLENLLDADYAEVAGYTSQGATVVLGLRYGAGGGRDGG